MSDKRFVQCVRDNWYPAGPASVTEGTVYEVIDEDERFYTVESDFGRVGVFYKTRFVDHPGPATPKGTFVSPQHTNALGVTFRYHAGGEEPA